MELSSLNEVRISVPFITADDAGVKRKKGVFFHFFSMLEDGAGCVLKIIVEDGGNF